MNMVSMTEFVVVANHSGILAWIKTDNVAEVSQMNLCEDKSKPSAQIMCAHWSLYILVRIIAGTKSLAHRGFVNVSKLAVT
jgi:hypothetical protein